MTKRRFLFGTFFLSMTLVVVTGVLSFAAWPSQRNNARVHAAASDTKPGAPVALLEQQIGPAPEDIVGHKTFYSKDVTRKSIA